MNRSNSEIEKMITDASFLYREPWFYKHPFALRCELGIGESKHTYLKNAKKRARATLCKDISALKFENSAQICVKNAHHPPGCFTFYALLCILIFKILRYSVVLRYRFFVQTR
jgi:hypothetical protein